MAVVCVYSESPEETGEEGETLFPLRLKPLDMPVWTVDRLCLLVGLPCSVEIGNECGRGVDWIAQLLVEPARLQNAQRLKVVLGEDVEVVCLCGHQVRIASGDRRIRGLVRIDYSGGHEVADVGASESAAVYQ